MKRMETEKKRKMNMLTNFSVQQRSENTKLVYIITNNINTPRGNKGKKNIKAQKLYARTKKKHKRALPKVSY